MQGNEEPRHNKSKEEIAHDMEMSYEAQRQRKFVKEKLYPWLIANSKSIDDAKNLVYLTNTAVEQTFHVKLTKEQTRMSQAPITELNPAENLNKEAAYDRERDLLSLFEGESVAVTTSLLKGMKLAIESFEREESTKRPLESLPAELLD